MREYKHSIQKLTRKVKRSIRKDKRTWINEQTKLAEEEEKKGDIRSFIILRENCLKENLG